MNGRALLLATRSPGKLTELRPLFAAAGWVVRDPASLGLVALPDEAGVECHDTFAANARAKARYFRRRSGDLPVVAEDSGLEVDALGGAPGVRSKRWSGRDDLTGPALDEANNALLLDQLRGVADRRARYVCAMVYVDGTREVAVRGEASGRIAEERQSGAHGFGYDPYFVSDALGRAFSAVSAQEKSRVSHRGRAAARLLAALARSG